MTLDIGALQAENDRLSTESQTGDYLANFVKMPEGNGALVLRLLPPAPEGYHFEVENVSKLISKVWLVHHADYDYACGRVVKTIHSFIKGSKNLTVHKPKNAANAYVKSFCTLEELGNQSGFSLYVPSVTKLFD